VLCFALSLVLLIQAKGSQRDANCSVLADIDAFLIDLDGTIYNPVGLIDGARFFIDWLVRTNRPFAFLSNSAAKGPRGLQAKLMNPPFKVFNQEMPLNHFFTASTGIANFLKEHAPAGSLIYILQSTSVNAGIPDSCVKSINSSIPKQFGTYQWRTDLSDSDIKNWAVLARNSPVFVVTCADGQLSDDRDPKTGQPGYTGWNFDILSRAGILLQNGAIYVSGAPDTHNMVIDPLYPTLDLNTPGPGTFFNLITSSTYPKGVDRTFVVGKGGNVGTRYSMMPAVDLLLNQGWDGDMTRLAIVGDTLNTDIQAGNDAGIISLLVTSGIHDRDDLPFYKAVPTCILDDVGDIPA